MGKESVIIGRSMDGSNNIPIPHRADTLKVLRLMGRHAPILMLGDSEGFGTRWVLDGQQVQPAIARYLMHSGHIAEAGLTDFGARKFVLTAVGVRFREEGLAWWDGLSAFQKLYVMVRG